jgi:acyl carrier protein
MSRQKRNKNIESSIKEIISFYVNAPLKDISLTASIESLGGDSLDFVEIVLEIEDKFAVLIPAEEADKFKNIGELIRYVKKNK